MRIFSTSLVMILMLIPLLYAAPRISSGVPVYDFGEASNNQVIEYAFPISNEGDEPLEIRKVHASCGCTAAHTSKESILPGEMAYIHASLNLTGRYGLQDAVISVSSNDPEQPEFHLHLKGTAFQDVRVVPSVVVFGHLKPDAPIQTKTIRILPQKGGIRILDAHTDAESVSISSPTPLGQSAKVWVWNVTLNPEGLKPGVVRESIIFQTDSTNTPTLTVPISAFIVE